MIGLVLGGSAPVGQAWAAPGAGKPIRWRVTTLHVLAGGPSSYAEPGIAAGPGGLMMLDAASANTGAPPTFWLSRDGGRSWPPGRDLDTTGASTGDADVAIGRDGFMYALNLGYFPGQASNPAVEVFRSPNGRSWSGPASFPPPHGLDQPDRPWLVVDPLRPAHVDVVNSEGSGNIVIWRSSDHGAHFSGPYPVTGGVNGQAALALSSRPLFDPTRAGRMYMLYETAGTGLGPPAGPPFYEFPLTQIWLATSTDWGLRWSSRQVLDTATVAGRLRGATVGHLLVASAIDPAGRIYGAFSARGPSENGTAIYLIQSADHGADWSAPTRIATPTFSNVMPALAVSTGGVAYLSWYGSRARDFRSARARWVEMFARVAGLSGARPRIDVTQVSGPKPVHVGGIDNAGTLGSNSGANWGLRDLQSITVGPCGQPHLVWAEDHRPTATQTAAPATRCRG